MKVAPTTDFDPLGHLGDLAAAFVDEQLGEAMRDLVLAHIAGCAGCRYEVDQQRQLKSRLRSLREPGLPAALLGTLYALNRPMDLPPVFEPAPEALAGPSNMSNARSLARVAVLADPRRSRRLLAGAASLMLVGAVTAYAAASDAHTAPARTGVTAVTASEPGDGSGAVPLNDPAFAAMTASFQR